MNQPLSPARSAQAVCPLDCADTCSLSVDVAGGRLAKVRGGNANPFTRGKICSKVARALPRQVHGPDRLLTPLLRDGPKGAGGYRQASWAEALDAIHRRFSAIIDRYGPQAIAGLTYAGPMGLLSAGSMDQRFFNRLGSSRVDTTPLCTAVSSAAWDSVYGDASGISYEELDHSRLIVVWGNNITTCNLHLVKRLRAARKRGARLVVIDPKKIRIADEADLHLALMPGTDVVLAYAVAAEMQRRGGLDREFIARYVHGADRFLEEASRYSLQKAASICGLDPADIAEFARMWCELSPAAISLGVAPERNRNGGSGVRAVLALPALSGNIGLPGAGVCDVSAYFPINREQLARPDLRREAVRQFNTLDLADHILNPGDELPLKALFIYNHNPLAVNPDQGRLHAALASEDLFVVGSEISMTDTMRCADVILPAASHLEIADLYKSYGHQYLQSTVPVLPPQGEAVANTELFRRLAARFGFDEPCFRDTDEQLVDQAINPGALGPGVASAGAIPPGSSVDMAVSRPSSLLRGAQPSTPSGRIELYSEQLEQACGMGLPRYQTPSGERDFVLVTPASEQRINSTFGGISGQDTDLQVAINPGDASDRGLEGGQWVRLVNDLGSVKLPLLVSERIRRGTLYVPKGAWMRDAVTGMTVNGLIPGAKADLAGGACYYDCRVDIEAPRVPDRG
ncbi:oxidoreductase [Seongchinamella sediminis]|uniref:Oxidoreductase n=1 Tax=Seongchinamella sediminis TaxID=2283635 RepID=A0A3L7DWD0_9GAMM|nr:molybdopterin-dependent oxidoreductase [Seongchinamella sediminis]RLQ21624.1 oxidoreductase [Seongchinamella sediminis]